MTAYYQVSVNDMKRIVRVENVRNADHAKEVLAALKARHADSVKLLTLENYALAYTANEVLTERNLFGGPRRYSTGRGTVTIPENEGGR
jgi:hypothetical protein